MLAERLASGRVSIPVLVNFLRLVMILLLLEALLALLLLVFIVWWTMFSGRKNGELKHDEAKDPAKPSDKP